MSDKDTNNGGKAGRKIHYCVLYTQVLKQWKVSEALQRVLPEGKGDVFYPCRELWWHGLRETVFRPLFPGYLFIRSEMDRIGLHELVSRTRRELISFVKELGADARWADGDESHGDFVIIDLTDEEEEFFDFLLGFAYDADLDRRRETAAEEGQLYRPVSDSERAGQWSTENAQTAENIDEAVAISDRQKAIASELRRRKKQIPRKGVAQMSFGYMENGRFVIMDGPLKGHEDHIKAYIAKDKKAHLDIGIGGKPAKVGMTILGKKVWFPKDKSSPDILPDGTVIDTKGLARLMMGG